jgi:hypothetical protein
MRIKVIQLKGQQEVQSLKILGAKRGFINNQAIPYRKKLGRP